VFRCIGEGNRSTWRMSLTNWVISSCIKYISKPSRKRTKTLLIDIFYNGLQRHRQVNCTGLYQNVFITWFLKVHSITAISPFNEHIYLNIKSYVLFTLPNSISIGLSVCIYACICFYFYYLKKKNPIPLIFFSFLEIYEKAICLFNF
jgi:hypothetical protein